MKFTPTKLRDVFIIDIEPRNDERGFFARLNCPQEFAAHGIQFNGVQTNLSRNPHLHTLRGMHYQDAPHAETKLVYATQGAVHDVVVDLRRDSPTFGDWTSVVLDADSLRAIYIPEGCAHGFLTLKPNTDVLYHMGHAYVPGQAKGYRWNDPRLNIVWPATPSVIGAADQNWPDFPAA